MTDILAVISGIGAVQCVLFMLLIVAKKQKKLTDWILLAWFLTFAIHLGIEIIRKSYPIAVAEVLMMTIGFLPGPFFLLYTTAVFNQRFAKAELLHFFPFLILTFVGFFIPTEADLQWEIFILIIKLISVTFYPLYVLYLYRKRQRLLKNNQASYRVPELFWIKIIVILFLLSTGISMIRLSTELIVGVAYFEVWDVLRYVILITVIGFYGLKYGVVYQPELVVEPVQEEQKYKHSSLRQEAIETSVDQINRFFETDKAYLLSDFSLATLSKAVNIPKHHLSQVINAEMGTTFYDLVNTKRIEYALSRLKEGDTLNVTLEGLGYECGFNSKSAFFHHFKKKTGKTPGQFKKEIGTA
ncbi:hypothetical protein BKI52_08565 [marine bacterium AO1-C]|nr:hypothetical protein BKI52_08565 [marine bacterium AO1-C]